MPERIPQSTTIRVPIRAFLAGTNTPVTGKIIAVTISKNGGAYANPSVGATNATEIGSGSYYVDLSTADTGTVGPLFIKAAEAAIDDVAAIYSVVLATNAGFTGIPNANAAAIGGLLTGSTIANTPLLPAITASWLTATGIAADAITAAKIADGAIDTATFAAGTTIPRVTLADTAATLTNLPTIPAGWLTAAGIAASALNGKGDWLLSSGYTIPPTAIAIRQEIDSNSVGIAAIYARTDVATSSRSTYVGTDTAGTTTLLGRVTAAVALAGTAPSWYSAPVDVSTNVSAIKAKTDSLTFTSSGKVDAKLTADGLDSIAATSPTGVATTFVGKLLQVWERFFGKIVKDDNAGTIKVMQGTGTTAQATQSFTSVSGVDTVTKAT